MLWQETLHPIVSIAWQQFAVALGCCFIVAVLIQSSTFKAVVKSFRLAPWRSLMVFFVAVSWFTLQGTTKAPDVVGKMMKLLFFNPASPWQLQVPHDDADAARDSAVSATNILVQTENIATNADIYTISFGWHIPNRLPYHAGQNVMGYTPWVTPRMIDGVLYEDHYVAFNAMASTNPAVVKIEYARTKDDGNVERYIVNTITNSYPDTYVVDLQSGSHTCYWFRCAVPTAFTNCVRDTSGEALFGGPVDSGSGFELVGTLIVDDGNNIWVGATTNMVIGVVTNIVRNGFIAED